MYNISVINGWFIGDGLNKRVEVVSSNGSKQRVTSSHGDGIIKENSSVNILYTWTQYYNNNNI